MKSFEHQVSNVLERIKIAADKSCRPADSVTLIAVSKTQPISAIKMAYQYGIRHFGENRSRELESKVLELEEYSDIEWNFIGSLQSKQSEYIAKYSNVFHAVDRVLIAKNLSIQLGNYNKILKIYVQVNVSGEISKGGFDCSVWEDNLAQQSELINNIKELTTLPNLKIQGLMTMAPLQNSANLTRKIFQRTRELSIWLKNIFPAENFSNLSMGMSGDYELAIEEGATCVRIGSAIFAEN